jgi:hypothetical protein
MRYLRLAILTLTIFFVSNLFADHIQNDTVNKTIWQLKKILNEKFESAKTKTEKHDAKRLSLDLLFIERLLKDYYRINFLLDKINDSNIKKTLLPNSNSFDNFGNVIKGQENKKYHETDEKPRLAERCKVCHGLGTNYNEETCTHCKGTGWEK